MDTATFIERLPKAENHLHIEGAIPWDMIRAGADETLPETPEWWGADFRYRDWAQFQNVMRLGISTVLTSPQGFYDVAKRIFEAQVAQNVRYTEVSFGLTRVGRPWALPAEIAPIIKAAAPEGLIVRVYCGFARVTPPEDIAYFVPLVMECDAVDGIDLHGGEMTGNAEPFIDLYRKARERGLKTRAHAGELRGAESVYNVLDNLHVKRIEHGTRAMEDAALVDRLRDEAITLDMCPTSNVKLQVVPSIKDHPIRQFLHHGIPVTVSTDDPSAFGCTLNGELHTLVDDLDFTLEELAQLQINAFNAVDIPEAARAALIGEVRALVGEL